MITNYYKLDIFSANRIHIIQNPHKYNILPTDIL